MRCHLFLPCRARLKATRATVVAYIPRIVDYHRSVINIGHVGDAAVGDGAVVVEVSSVPLPAGKSHAGITESVINSAIEANVRPPVSRVPDIESPAPSPITWRPQHADRRHHPGTRNPVVAVVVVPSPVARRPEIAWAGADGLRVNRQRRC